MQVWFSVRAVALLAAVGVSALALACGGGGAAKESGSTKPAETKSTTAASSGGVGERLSVELADFKVTAARATTKAGKVEITVKNTGTTPHELVILKADNPASLTKNASGMVDEAKYPPLGRTKQLDGGGSEKLEVSLAAGKYALICNVVGHYDLGMRTALTVN
ncbi:MAG: hypothetical protein EXR66_01835 [Dehalococcoidia bacterium]|nr:hypothetical protein [Dehalococcoidia bacterium]